MIEVRIGNARLVSAYGLKPITTNTKCGSTSGTDQKSLETFKCSTPLDGRYLSLQSLADKQLNIGEINIFTTG